MKTLNRIYLLIAMLIFISCDNYLDIEPKGKVIPKTIKDYDLLLNGGDYGPINITTDDLTLFLTADDFVSTDRIDQLGNVDNPSNIAAAIYRWDNNLFTKGDPQAAWNSPYKNIFTYNTVIENIDQAEASISYTDSDKKRIKAEALVGRAYEYWLLVNTFGKQYSETSASTDLGVPLITVGDVSETAPTRASVKEIYDFILKDVNNAIKDLPQKAVNKIRPSKGTGYAFLARFYLSMGKYEKALENASLAIAEKGIIGDYSTIDRGNDGAYTSEHYILRLFPTVYGYINGTLSDEISVLYATKDARINKLLNDELWVYDSNIGWHPIHTGNYKNATKLRINHAVSVPEMYLIRAECNARLDAGTINDIIEDLNTLRVKRIADYIDLTAADPDFTNKTKALAFILKERRREMLLSGMRLFDLKRLNLEPTFAKSVTHTIKGVDYTLEAGANNLILPIPAEVLNFNPNMKQNIRD
jgi:tetratricopeptide (TPR) repeat protein